MRTNPFQLTDEDCKSDLWQRISAHLEGRLMTLREKNDRSASPEETADTRGRIAEVKKMLGLAEEKPKFTKKTRLPDEDDR